jgi:hypothetical protein
MSVINTIWQVEIKMIMVQGQHRDKKLERPHLNSKSWVLCHASVLPVMREVIGRKSRAEVSPRQNNIIYLKNNKSKKKRSLWLSSGM